VSGYLPCEIVTWAHFCGITAPRVSITGEIIVVHASGASAAAMSRDFSGFTSS
jgi:hypothetical protein